MKWNIQTYLAFLISPLATIPIVFAAQITFGLLKETELSHGLKLNDYFLVLIVSYLGMLFVGLPVHLFCIWKKITSFRAYAITGAIVPTLVILLGYTSEGWEEISRAKEMVFYSEIIFFSFFGLAVASMFWFVGVHKVAPNKAIKIVR